MLSQLLRFGLLAPYFKRFVVTVSDTSFLCYQMNQVYGTLGSCLSNIVRPQDFLIVGENIMEPKGRRKVD